MGELWEDAAIVQVSTMGDGGWTKVIAVKMEKVGGFGVHLGRNQQSPLMAGDTQTDIKAELRFSAWALVIL